MPILESNQYGLWVGKQTAKGTPNMTPGKRMIQVGGDYNMPRDDGSENYSDLTKYGNATDWVNSLVGNGEPALEATPTELAYWLWLHHGAETVTAVTGPPTAQKHSFVPSNGLGHYFTSWVRVGQSVIRRHRFDDCISTKVVIEGSTANKALRLTPTVLSLDPGKIFTADPSGIVMPTDPPFLYTDATGAFTIDGTVFKAQSQFQLTIDDAWTPLYTEDIIPFEIVQGSPSVTLALTLYFDSVMLAKWNTYVYGTASPTVGTPPIKSIPALGSYLAHFKSRNAAGNLTGREFKATLPGVKWSLPDAPGPNPDGGASEVTLTGEMRAVSGQPLYTLDVNTDNSVVAFTT